MKTLLANRFAPITFSFGFLEAPVLKIGEFVDEWYQSLSKSFHSKALSSTLADALRTLAPLTATPTKKVFLSTRSPWTVCFDNCKIGTDPSLVRYASGQMRCRGLLVTCSPQTMSRTSEIGHGNYGAVIFELLGPRKYPNTDRAIWLANDGGRWEFGANGEVQPFEHPERYERKGKFDRFDSEMLEEYCRALGIKLFDEAFYGLDGVLFEIDEQDSGASEISLAEVQAQLDLDKISDILK